MGAAMFAILLLSVRLCFGYRYFNLTEKEVESLYTVILDKDYNKNIPPLIRTNNSTRFNPLKVVVYLQIERNPIVKEEEQVIILDGSVDAYWNDNRLSTQGYNVSFVPFSFSFAPPEIIDKMWLPRITFQPMKELKYANNGIGDTRKAVVRPMSDGNVQVRYTHSCSLELICEMEFDLYPMDVQICQWKILAKQDFVNLTWPVKKSLWITKKKWARELELPSFQFRFETTQGFSKNYLSPEALYLNIYLRRNLSTHLLMTYFPSGLLVIISWCSFIIDPDKVPGRVALMVTSLLTLVTMFSSLSISVDDIMNETICGFLVHYSYLHTNFKGIQFILFVDVVIILFTVLNELSTLEVKTAKQIQRVSLQKLSPSFNVKPVEVWLMVCMSFVVVALLEYAFILLGVRCKAVRNKQKSEMVFALPLVIKPMMQQKMSNKRWKCVNVCLRWCRAVGNVLRRNGCLDAISLLMFPLAFLVFNAYYWIHHLTKMNNKWEGFLAGKPDE